ncbi:MAG TPA: winged helix-turn-helix domain-containing protein [Caulobacteraceae bacterium]|nr:winged helix-turn-helix domain-containing protein [Caulobacteraceae bacterium]
MASERPFEFGEWRVDAARGLLTAPGRQARLEPKLMDLLVLFAGSGGRVLSKDEIVEAAWAGRAIGDDTLAAAVSRLRRALGETPERRYIETVPKRGYRALVDVSPPAGGGSRAPTPGPAEAEALVAEGVRALASPFGPGLAQARLYFEAAAREAPAWSPAHQGLADAVIARHFADPRGADLAVAKAAAHTAVALDDASAPAWATLGFAILLADRDFAAADAALQRALALDASHAPARRRRAFAFATVGRFVEAERESRRAVELQSASLEGRGELLQLLLAARRYRHAAAEATAALALAPMASEGWYARGWALVLAGDERDGVDALLRGLELWGADAERLSGLRAAYAAEGFAALARAAADLFMQQQVLFARRMVDVAILRTLGGEADAAFEALEDAAERDDPVLLLFPWLPYFDALKPDPRYDRFVKRLRLVR